MTFTVDRATWMHGSYLFRYPNGHKGQANEFMEARPGVHFGTRLYNPTLQTQCCLGFVAEQLGVPKGRLAWEAEPVDLCGDPATDITGLLGILIREYDISNTSLAKEAMGINDDSTLITAQREARLQALFERHGHTLVFTGDWPAPRPLGRHEDGTYYLVD